MDQSDRFTINEVAVLAEDLLAHHGLYKNGWRFRLDRARQRLGSCDYDSQTITLSRVHIENGNKKEVYDTILHEVAHAIVGPGHGHGPKWQRTAKLLGATPSSHARVSYKQQYRYVIACGLCKRVLQKRHNAMSASRLATRYCLSCGRDTIGKLKLLKV